MADPVDALRKFLCPVSGKNDTHTVVSLLVYHACLLPYHNLIAYIKQHKSHKCTLLLFIHVHLIHFRIRVYIKHCHSVAGSLESNSHPLQFIQANLHISGAFHQTIQCLRTDHICILMIILGNLGQRLHLPLFFFPGIQFFLHIFDNLGQLHGSNRLQHIFAYIILYCFFCILELPEAAEDHDQNIRIIIMEKMAQLHSIHIRHENICENNIYLMCFYKLHSLLPVLTVSYQFTIQLSPVNILPDGIPDKDLIIHQ